MRSENPPSWPPPRIGQGQVVISALEGGKLTLFEKYFVFPSDPSASALAPSMAFLISHPEASMSPQKEQSGPFRILFDLGLRSGIDKYVAAIQAHIKARINDGGTYEFQPGVLDSLQQADISPVAINVILLSHIHWDHHGDITPFNNATVIVGPHALSIMMDGIPNPASHMHFDPAAIPFERTMELPPTSPSNAGQCNSDTAGIPYPLHWKWQQLGPFPAAIDFFADGSVFIINAPGHLTGHVNLLCRVAPQKWVYLGGDSCHDVRLLTGEKNVATWTDDRGCERCIHLEKDEAIASIERIRDLKRCIEEAGESLEVIMAHDHVWYRNNREKFLPGKLV